MPSDEVITLRADQLLLLRKLAKEFANELSLDPQASQDDIRGLKRFGRLVDDILTKGDSFASHHIERLRLQKLTYYARENTRLEKLLDDTPKEV